MNQQTKPEPSPSETMTAEQFWHSDSNKYMSMGRFDFAEAYAAEWKRKAEAAEREKRELIKEVEHLRRELLRRI